MAAGARDIRAGGAFVELFTKDAALRRGLLAAQARLKAFGAALMGIGTKMLAVGAALTAPFLLAAKVYADMGGQLVDLSQQTGLTVEALTELGHAADMSGSDLETFVKSIRKMQQNLSDAAGGSKAVTANLAKLGLTIEQLKDLAPDEQFTIIADALSKVEDPAAKTALAMDLFGKSGAMLLPMMKDGAQGIAKMREETRRLGLSMSTTDAIAAEEFGDKLQTMQKQFKMAAFTIGQALAPAIEDISKWLSAAIRDTRQWIEENSGLVTIIFKLTTAIIVGGAAFFLFGTILSGIGMVLTIVIGLLSALSIVLGIITSIFAGAMSVALTIILTKIMLILAPIVGLIVAMRELGLSTSSTLDKVTKDFGSFAETVSRSWEGIGDAIAAGDLGAAGKIAMSALKMEFHKGLLWLQEQWLDFKHYFLDLWQDAIFGFGKMLNSAIAGWQAAFEHMGAFMVKAAVDAQTALTPMESDQFEALMKAQATGDFEQIGKIMRGHEERTGAAKAKDRIDEELRERLKAIEKEHAAEQEKIDLAHKDEVEKRKAAGQAALAGRQNEIEMAKKEWEDALANAKRLREEADKNKITDQLAKKLPKQKDISAMMRNRIEVRGTFSGDTRGLGVGTSIENKQLEELKAIHKNIEELNREAKHGGLVFA